MAQLTVKQLIAELVKANPDALVSFQANVQGEEDHANEEPGHTLALGYVYSGFVRNENEFVIDGAVTESEPHF